MKRIEDSMRQIEVRDLRFRLKAATVQNQQLIRALAAIVKAAGGEVRVTHKIAVEIDGHNLAMTVVVEDDGSQTTVYQVLAPEAVEPKA